jgi:hypothetical protein
MEDDQQNGDVAESRRLKALERTRATQRIVNAYHRVFSGEDGKTVLSDMSAAFGFNLPAFLSTGNRPGQISFDTHYAAKRDGQHDVYLHIQARLSAPVEGDANIEEPRDKVLTGLSE